MKAADHHQGHPEAISAKTEKVKQVMSHHEPQKNSNPDKIIPDQFAGLIGVVKKTGKNKKFGKRRIAGEGSKN